MEYEEIVAKQSKKKPTTEDIQRWRYGAERDRQRYFAWQAVRRYAGYVSWVAGFAAALATIIKAWLGSGGV